MAPDLSTIDLSALAKRPKLTLPPSHHLSATMGSACLGDPPGFPSYFLRSIYDQHGNEPSHPRSATMELLGHVIARAGDPDSQAKRDALLRSLYKPLPLDHPRVQAWIADRFRHLRACFYPPGVQDGAPLVEGFDPIPVGSIPAATARVRRFYPDFHPTPAHLRGNFPIALWWETDAIRPTPATCKPRWHSHAFGNPSQRCQWCGYPEA